MKAKKKKEPKLPEGYTYDPALDKFSGKVLFPKKAEEAKRFLKRAGLPDDKLQRG